MKKKSVTIMIFATLLIGYGVFGIFTLFMNDAGTVKDSSSKQVVSVNEAQAAETDAINHEPLLTGKAGALRIKRIKLAVEEQPHRQLHRSLTELSDTMRLVRHKYQKMDKTFCDKSLGKNETMELAKKANDS